MGRPPGRGGHRPRFRRGGARLPVRGAGLPGRRIAGEGGEPAQPLGPRGCRGRRGRARRALRRGGFEPGGVRAGSVQAHPPGRPAHRIARPALRHPPDGPRRLRRGGPRSRPRPRRVARVAGGAAGRATTESDPPGTGRRSRPARPPGRPRHGRRRARCPCRRAGPSCFSVRARGVGCRARPHRLGLAVAGPRDRAQGGPHHGVHDRAHRRDRRLRLRHVERPAVRLGQGAPARGVVADRRRSAVGAVPALGWDVGGERHRDAVRRVDGAPVPLRAAVLRRRARGPVEGRVAARQLRLLARPATAGATSRVRVVLHAEDLVEPGQHLPAPHLPVGGHRRLAGADPLPADGHLQLRAVGRRARAGRPPVPRPPDRVGLDRPGRLGRWRRRHDP